jgi:hypothetical protein
MAGGLIALAPKTRLTDVEQAAAEAKEVHPKQVEQGDHSTK